MHLSSQQSTISIVSELHKKTEGGAESDTRIYGNYFYLWKYNLPKVLFS